MGFSLQEYLVLVAANSAYRPSTLWRLSHLARTTQWQPTSVLLPGKSHGQSSLVGCSPQRCKESCMTEGLTHSTDIGTYTTKSEWKVWQIASYYTKKVGRGHFILLVIKISFCLRDWTGRVIYHAKVFFFFLTKVFTKLTFKLLLWILTFWWPVWGGSPSNYRKKTV